MIGPKNRLESECGKKIVAGVTFRASSYNEYIHKKKVMEFTNFKFC